LSVVESRLDVLYKSTRETKAIGEGGEDFDTIEDARDGEDDNILDLDLTPPADANGRIIRMVNQILEQALRNRASDIHLEPFEDGCKFRLRIDGVLHELPPPSKSIFIMIVSRFKVLAKMDIAEKRIPQDGAIALRTGDKRIDLRVNTVPTVHGEKMVMRILDKGAIPLELTGLGLDERQSRDLTESIQSPYGLALVTGPTGSGKSTSLYSCLNRLNDSKVNICTVEDPVEYKFKGMNQVQVKAQVGLTFSSALRAFLRQDPDIIMVGEIRDFETAEIAVKAALTGHLVLSTLHTNDAPATISRLLNMGVEPFLITASVNLVLAQRLARKICPDCRQQMKYERKVLEDCGFSPEQIANAKLVKGAGCRTCNGSGYKGRVALYEVMRFADNLKEMVLQGASTAELKLGAIKNTMSTLRASGIRKIIDGVTTPEEVMRVTMSD